MKKVVSLFSVCLLIAALMVMMVVPASAATAQDTILNAFKENVPEKYSQNYLPALQNVLQQLKITDEQATQVVACIEDAKNVISSDKGQSLDKYSAAERAALVEKFDAVCEILDLHYEVKASENPVHKNDVMFVVYDASGKKLGDIDLDGVKKTDVADPINVEFAVLAVVLMAGAVAATLYGKKFVASR